MNQNFGPWTTAMSEGSNAQLSTFWKRRMNMLKRVEKTGTKLSGQQMFCLIVIAAACFAFPTYHHEATANPLNRHRWFKTVNNGCRNWRINWKRW
jgi:hypothetical protein